MSILRLSSRASATLPCEASLIFELLTDYDGYSEWMPLVTHSKLLAREGDLALAEIGISQPHPDKLVFECIHDKNRSVLGRAIGGTLPISRIEWTLEPAGTQTKVSVLLEGKTDWHWLLPAYRKAMHAEQYLEAIQGQVSAFSPDLLISGASGETILDLMETGEGLVLVFRGRKYTLQPAAPRHS
jgi:ribosome-associated toxin RatA of RatAB toxin-antitoxin module